MGEYERSYLVFRATVESSFRRESGVAGFLEGQGQFVRSVDVMSRLLREYPPEAYVAAASYALAQQVYAKAPEAAADAEAAQAEDQPRRPAPPGVGDARELLDGLSRRSGRRPGRASPPPTRCWT